MKHKLKISVIAMLLCAAFASIAYAQRPPIAGGLKDVALNDKEVIAAANFAVITQSKDSGAVIKLLSIEKAAAQVVAGRNYALCMSVENADGATAYAKALVYLNLQQEMSLTSWDGVKSCEVKAPDETPAQEPVIVGGYGDAGVDDAGVLEAANFAVKAGRKKADGFLKLDSIEHAQMQVVAGYNYAMCLRVRSKTDKPGKTHLIYAIVYQNTSNKMSLTSIKKVSTCPKE